MSRYHWCFEERDAYDAGHGAYWRNNPHDRYEERRLHEAYEDGYDDQRRERERYEERRAEEAAEEARARHAREEAAYDEAMYEEQEYAAREQCEPVLSEEEEG